ncbi:hypothetical protein [Bradyrhizobium sp.]|uniref:hypothetical protein n=1 Tax=Bradyrhizobium sp. TaxID=376 RepID=UPI002CE60C48|nr:hypothetical protein [Bradyrhizobium sp.]HMM91197.1 hypothetical protein [Bradyrhizobium sp.]
MAENTDPFLDGEQPAARHFFCQLASSALDSIEAEVIHYRIILKDISPFWLADTRVSSDGTSGFFAELFERNSL